MGPGEVGAPGVRGSHEIYRGRVIALRLDDVEFADGSVRSYEVVEHPGAVCVIASPRRGEIVLVRQYRPAIGRSLLEVPAGKLDPGEDPAACAARELREETGYRCRSVRVLWSFYTSPGFCDERIHLCVAEGLEAGSAEPEEYEQITVEVTGVETAWAMVERGEIPDAKTQIALSCARGLEGLRYR